MELELERLRQHLCSSRVEREGRFLCFPCDESVFGLYFLVSALGFVGVVVESVEEREKGEVLDSGVAVDESLSTEGTLGETL